MKINESYTVGYIFFRTFENSANHYGILIVAMKKEKTQSQPEEESDQKKPERSNTKMNLFETILNNSQDVIYCLNMDTGRFEYISPSALNVVGYSAEELMSKDKKSSLVMVHPDHIHILRNAIKVCEETGKASAEYLQITTNGTYRWMSNQMAVCRDENGVLFLHGNVRDITEYKNNEEALQNLNYVAIRRLKEIENLYNNLPVGLCLFDMELRYIRINEKLAAINGLPVSEHIGRTVKEIIPAFYDLSANILQRIINTRMPQLGMEFTGSSREEPSLIRTWTEDWIPVTDDNGNIVGISVVVTEITEQKKYKENLIRKQKELKKTKLALERSQKKLDIALDNGKIGIWERNLRTDKIIWDNRTEEIFGFQPGTFDGSLSTLKECIHEEDYHHLSGIVNRAIAAKKPYEAVYRTSCRNGESNYISEKAYLVTDKNGEPVKLIGVCFDVTDMKKGVQQVIMKMNEDLIRSNNDLQQFAYVASHDLQEPLRMVSSFTQLLQMRYHDKLDAEANEYINFAVEGSKRMYALLNDLLAFSRVHSKAKSYAPVDMNKVLSISMENLLFKIKETNALIENKELPVVSADQGLMVQLLQNLIDNALKFSKGVPQIFVSSEEKDDSFLFSVRDKGIGINPEYFEKIFKIFQRLHNRSEYNGTGIGLAICKRIVEKHNGRIWVESSENEGSAFYFTIPKTANINFM